MEDNDNVLKNITNFSSSRTSNNSDPLPSFLWMSSSSTEDPLNIMDFSSATSDEISRFSRSLLTFAAVMTIIIMIVGIFGNLLTVVALIKCPKVRNVAAAFIISLCLADCIFCAIVLPFSAFRFIQGTWTHGDFLCRVIPFMQYGNIGVSLLCIAMITINRYIMIAHHNSYAKIYKKQWIAAMIIFCWLFSYGMQLPTFFEIWGRFGYDGKLGTCSILPDQTGRSSKTALFIIAFLFPCVIIIGCYARIFWVVHESELRLRQHATKQNSIPNNLRPMPGTSANRISSPGSSSSFNDSVISGADGTKDQRPSASSLYQHHQQRSSMKIKDQRDAKARRNEWRITKMVLAIFLSFIMCYLPITVIKVCDKDVKMPGFHIFGYIMLYLSACINPIIYVIMNKQYRQAYKTTLTCKVGKLLPFTQSGNNTAEKWKDIGYSYNHSRTMVSQVSIADQNSNSGVQPVIMELTSSNNRNSMMNTRNRSWPFHSNTDSQANTPTNTNSNIIPSSNQNYTTNSNNTISNINNNQHQHSNNNNNNINMDNQKPLNHLQVLVQSELPPLRPQYTQRQTFQHPLDSRTILNAEDVIAEEESMTEIDLSAKDTPDSNNKTKEGNIHTTASTIKDINIRANGKF